MRNDEGRERQTVKQRLHTSPPETTNGGAGGAAALEEKVEEEEGGDAGATKRERKSGAVLLEALPKVFGEFVAAREQELRGRLGGAVGKADVVLVAAEAEILCWRVGALALSKVRVVVVGASLY